MPWRRALRAAGLIFSCLLLTPSPTLAQFTQQGPKLVGTDAIGGAQQGIAVALSADGNTAIVGGNADNNVMPGAVWVFTRNGGVWTQQGTKLVVTDGIIPPDGVEQGFSVSLSADGNTAIFGGPDDNGGIGAAWVFTRNNGVWTEQGKLVGTGVVGSANFRAADAFISERDDHIPVMALGRLAYNPTTGELWRTDSAGTLTRELATWYWSEWQGRPIPTSIYLPDGTRRTAPRVMYYIVHQRWPGPAMYIDHIDRDPTNNRAANLREATPAQNQQNADRQSRRWNGRDELLEQGVTLARPGRYVVVLGGVHYGTYRSRHERTKWPAACAVNCTVNLHWPP